MRMRKRSPSRPMEIELFPFLSVLACTIGTLILMIIIMTTQTFSSQREVTIIAKNEAGKNIIKTPRYLECRGDGIIIYPQEEFVAKKDMLLPSSSLNKLISELSKNRKKEYLIIAIRPEGIEVFQEIRKIVEAKDIDLGYEPIEKGWKLKIEEE